MAQIAPVAVPLRCASVVNKPLSSPQRTGDTEIHRDPLRGVADSNSKALAKKARIELRLIDNDKASLSEYRICPAAVSRADLGEFDLHLICDLVSIAHFDTDPRRLKEDRRWDRPVSQFRM